MASRTIVVIWWSKPARSASATLPSSTAERMIIVWSPVAVGFSLLAGFVTEAFMAAHLNWSLATVEVAGGPVACLEIGNQLYRLGADARARRPAGRRHRH